MPTLEKITAVTGQGVYVPGDDIDTDRIIPARFMKCITFDGLGEYVFFDERKDGEGKDKPHPLNDPRFRPATILLTGDNFGCGSSREHAPQALHKYGFRAVVAESYAEIFFGNATTLGMPCVMASREDIRRMGQAVVADPSLSLTIEIEKLEIRFGEDRAPIELRESARQALLAGKWDPIAELMEGVEDVDRTAAKLPYMAV